MFSKKYKPRTDTEIPAAGKRPKVVNITMKAGIHTMLASTIGVILIIGLLLRLFHTKYTILIIICQYAETIYTIRLWKLM